MNLCVCVHLISLHGAKTIGSWITSFRCSGLAFVVFFYVIRAPNGVYLLTCTLQSVMKVPLPHCIISPVSYFCAYNATLSWHSLSYHKIRLDCLWFTMGYIFSTEQLRIFTHLKKVIKLLRNSDTIKLVSQYASLMWPQWMCSEILKHCCIKPI